MKQVPPTRNRSFESKRLTALVNKYPESVCKGINIYKQLREQSKVEIIKTRGTSLTKSVLSDTALMITRVIGNPNMISFNLLLQILTRDTWTLNHEVIEELELSPDETKFLYFVVRYNGSTNTYDFAVCYSKANCKLNREVFTAGLITEGLLGKDNESRLYLQL